MNISTYSREGYKKCDIFIEMKDMKHFSENRWSDCCREENIWTMWRGAPEGADPQHPQKVIERGLASRQINNHRPPSDSGKNSETEALQQEGLASSGAVKSIWESTNRFNFQGSGP